MNPWFEHIQANVSRFNIETDHYTSVADAPLDNIKVSGAPDNTVHYRSSNLLGTVNIHFRGCSRCQVFIGLGFKGSVEISITGNDSLIYIGNNCRLNLVEIKSRASNDMVVVGNGVTTSGRNSWVSGAGAGSASPALIIGDDCMFSYDISLRNSDAHPIFELATGNQVNMPASAVILEPHVWVGERSSILKDVTVGACSVIALGSIVTKSTPRFSMIRGVPATFTVREDLLWARNSNPAPMASARRIAAAYLPRNADDVGAVFAADPEPEE